MKKILAICLTLVIAIVWLSNLNPQKAEAEDLDPEAVVLAQMLYSLPTSNLSELRTMCWCVFNRADHPGFPRSVVEVVRQPGQFPGYGPGNPVDMRLYRIAQEELANWREQGRTQNSRFVYPNRINGVLVLMNRCWMSGMTDIWRYGC